MNVSLSEPALESPEADIVVDGVHVDSASLSSAADKLAERVCSSGHRCIALCSPRADRVAVAVLACRRAQVALLLLRRLPAVSVLRDWRVEALFEDDFSLSPTGVAQGTRQGFEILLTTSGTTGKPKVARHDPARILGRIRRPNSTSAKPVWLLAFHPASFAGLQVTLSALVGGGRLVTCSSPTVSALAAEAARQQVSHVSATPTFWRAFIMALGEPTSRLPLKQATLGGETVDQAILDRMMAAFPAVDITHIYASTEAGAVFGVKDARAGFPAQWLNETIEGVSLRIHQGVLQVMSPRSMDEYLPGTGDSPLTAEGWLDTRDRVVQRGDRVYFVGRLDTIINVGGANVSPEEVEAALMRTPGLADLRISGIRNAVSGQVIAAELVLEPGHDRDVTRRAMLALARQVLEPYQVPRIVRVVDAIEYSESGKKLRT